MASDAVSPVFGGGGGGAFDIRRDGDNHEYTPEVKTPSHIEKYDGCLIIRGVKRREHGTIYQILLLRYDDICI